MATESITFDILARDRASAQFDKIARSTSTLESRFAKFTSAARNVASVLVGAEIGKSVLEAADAFELSRSRLETITKNVGSNFEDIAKQVDVADKHLATFGYTSAETEGALASLESVTRNPTKALTDLSLAADIARGRNIGLSEATLILQRVETGHISQLAKLGIATKDATGHTLTQAQALQMLTDLYGGAASKYAQTFAGQQAALSAEMKNSAAEIGVALLPAAVSLARVIQQDVIPPIVGLAHWLDRNKNTIEPLAKAVLIGVGAWKLYKVAAESAAAANALFARSAVTAEAGAVAASVAASRARLLGFGTVLAGGAAVYGGQKASAQGGQLGQVGRVVTDAGFGAIVGGSVAGAPGAAVGAVGGAAFGLTTNALNDFFPQKKKGDPTDADVVKNLGPAAKQMVAAYGSVDAALYGLNAASQSNLALQHEMWSAWNTTGQAAVKSAAQIEAAARKNIDLAAAQDSLRQAFQQAAQVAADNGRALTGNSDAALANRDAIRREVDAIFSVIDAMKAHGATSSATTQMLGYLEHALEINATKTYGDKAAVDALLKSLGLIPAQVSIAAQALASLTPGNQALLDSDTPSKGAIQSLNQNVAKLQTAGKKMGAAVAKSYTEGFTPVVAKGADKAAKALQDAMDRAKQKMQSDLDQIRSDLDNAKSGLVQFASIANNAVRTDSLGASGPPLPLQAYKKQQAQRLEQFARLFGQLRKLGLNLDDLRDFVQAGPDAIPAMQQLLATGRGGIRSENRLEARINRAAGSVAQQEVASMDSKLLHSDLTKLPKKFAGEFARELRHLHIDVNLSEADRKLGARVVAEST